MNLLFSKLILYQIYTMSNDNEDKNVNGSSGRYKIHLGIQHCIQVVLASCFFFFFFAFVCMEHPLEISDCLINVQRLPSYLHKAFLPAYNTIQMPNYLQHRLRSVF